MYRIELAPGEETVFRTLEELAIGVRNGLVTPRSRIYHNASEKWLPIEFHPHYKKALQLPIGRPSEPSPRGSDKPRMDTLSFAVAPSASKKATEAVTIVQAAALDTPSQHAPVEQPRLHAPVEQPRHDPGTPAAAQDIGPAPQAEPPVTIDHDFSFETHDRAPIRSEQLEVRAASAFERPPATPEPTSSAPTFAASPRPDSYLPASSRLVADDPHAVIAPTTATVPWASPPSLQEPISTGAASLAPEPFELPTISYPEITPAEAPLVERSGPGRGRRSLQIVAAIVVLATGGYLARSFYSPVARGADRSESVQAERPALPAAERPIPSTSAAPKSPAVAATAPARAPAVVNRAPLTAAPASSGFAAALEPRAQAFGPAPVTSRITTVPAAVSSDSSVVAASLAPAPSPAPIDLPVLTGGVPQVTAPAARNDSAMKRILRAVSGGKDAKQP